MCSQNWFTLSRNISTVVSLVIATMWKTCRDQDKALRTISLDHKKKAERKKEYFASKFQDPVHTLKVTNCGVEVKKDPKAYHQLCSDEANLYVDMICLYFICLLIY
jgi:hypothetical protein